MKKKSMSFVLVICMCLSLCTTLTACSTEYPFKKGEKIEKKIKVDKEYKIGDIDKTGWELDLPQDTFGQTSTMTMKVLSLEESKKYQKEEFTLIGTPLELSLSNKKNVRLNKPVLVTLQLPKEQLKKLAAEELFYGYYYNDAWEYFLPENIDMEKGTASFYIYHFSFLGFGKPSEEKQIETFAKTMAAKEWQRQQKTAEFSNATTKQFDDLFKSIGVNSATARNQLAADVISYLEDKYIDSSGVSPIDALAQMSNSASQGSEGMQAYKDKFLEYTGKALVATLEKDPASFASSVNIVGNLASAAGALAGGDKKAALESLANMLKGAVPQAILADAALKYVKGKMEDTIEYWTAAELEKAYQIYATGVGGKYGYEDGLKGDFNTIFTLLGGIDRQMDINIIKQYCEKKNIDVKKISEKRKNEILANAKSALKKNFDQRIVSEVEIKKIQTKEESFIAAIKKEGLLGASSYQKYFGIEKNIRNYSINTRLSRLYTIKNNMLNMMDKDMAESISDESLAKIISQWIYWNEKKDTKGFYKYMREMGYLKKTLPNYKGEGYWSLISTDVVQAVPSPGNTTNITNGSGSINVVSSSSGDVFTSSMTWSKPENRYNGEEEVELTISVKIDTYTWNGKNDGYIHMGLNYMSGNISAHIDEPDVGLNSVTRGAISLVDEDGKDYGSVSTDNGKIVVGSQTLKVKAVFPKGYTDGDLRTIYVTGSAGAVRYNYIWKK